MRARSMLAAIVALALGGVAQASDNQWHFEAVVDVPAAGLTETLIPAGLVVADEVGGNLDLVLLGPDGNPRAFELIWRDNPGLESLPLKDFTVRLDRTAGLLWEAALPAGFVVEKIEMDLPQASDMGTALISAHDSGGWHKLAGDMALYAEKDGAGASLEIKPAVYDALRLSFKGYDKALKEVVFPVGQVRVSGRRAAEEDYAESTVTLRYRDSERDGQRVIEAELPGKGLVMEALRVTTAAWFQGSWSLGYEAIVEGRPVYREVYSGTRESVGEGPSALNINLSGAWPERSMVLKLDTKGRYIGKVQSLEASVRLPRMLFQADRPGVYRVRTGYAKRTPVGQGRGTGERRTARHFVLSMPRANEEWRPVSLAQRFALEGGPFEEEGYEWKALVDIKEPGFYKIYLDDPARLGFDTSGIRLVRDAKQIPWFAGPEEDKTLDLQALDSYDRAENRSVWTLKLPANSKGFRGLRLESEGIFRRRVMLSIPGEVKTAKGLATQVLWTNAEQGPAILTIPLYGVPAEASEIVITIPHEDNRPIAIKGIKAEYTAPVILFLVNSTGGYYLYGGNKEARVPAYDLAMVKAHLSGVEPLAASIQEPVRIKPKAIGKKLRAAFEDKSWGLYAVLGLVTLALVLIIARLFPKDKA